MPLPGAGWPPPPPHWPDAACHAPGVDPLWFFPKKGAMLDRARKICAGCPHQLECRDWAVAAPIQLVGIWGGTSQQDRRVLRRDRHLSAGMILEPGPIEDHDGTMTTIETADLSPANGSDASSNGHQSTCTGCGKRLTGRQQAWCSTACKKRTEYRRVGRPRRDRTQTGVALSAPAVTGTWPEPALLASAGLTVTGFVVELAGEPWILTRSYQGRTSA